MYVFHYKIFHHLGTGPRNLNLNSAQRNVLHVGMVLVAAYVVCWSYLTVLHAMWVHGLTNYRDVKWKTAIAVILVNSCVNPFIYSIRYKEFQKTARKLQAKVFDVLKVLSPNR